MTTLFDLLKDLPKPPKPIDEAKCITFEEVKALAWWKEHGDSIVNEAIFGGKPLWTCWSKRGNVAQGGSMLCCIVELWKLELEKPEAHGCIIKWCNRRESEDV